ncbi:GAF domain-containing protein [Halosimplex salinum]|uniref:GAF domain-containing protein n=1 Tax=Halosimplex salinum TaxID=1710538 RepID=UPI0013DE23BA|nr:GAF domain-containing protein [Halosimplex salinum]
MGSKLERLFDTETEEFGLEYAFLSRIDRDVQSKQFEVVHAPNDAIEAGESIPLSASYCQKTIEDPTGTLVIDDALAEGWANDPAYERFGLRSYVGTTVTVEDELYGTLCFADTIPREPPIVDEEIVLLEVIGLWATYEVNQWTGPPTDETISRNLGEQEPPRSSQVDSMMETLGERARRFVLQTLLDDTSEDGVAILERANDLEDDRVQLHHVHIPTLESDGYVDWDRDANTVFRGPNYSRIEPFVRLLNEYTDEFSE